MSFKPEIRCYKEVTFGSNALAFATREEAENWAKALFNRWFAAEEWRVVESDEPVSHVLVSGELQPLPGENT